MLKFIGYAVLVGAGFFGGLYYGESNRSSTVAHTTVSTAETMAKKTAEVASAAGSAGVEAVENKK